MGRLDSLGHVHLAEQDRLLETCEFDSFERAALSIARRFFMAFSRPEEHAWMTAFEEAEETFPPPFGATLALAVLRTIRTLRAARTSTFTFAHPDCPVCEQTVTQEERYFISILKAVRQCRRSDAMTYALLVCEGGDPEKLVQSFETMCIIIGEGPLASAQTRAATSPAEKNQENRPADA
ncbi:MAG: hypothetical protein AAGE80_01030 [Pseudomonadota bacterium]